MNINNILYSLIGTGLNYQLNKVNGSQNLWQNQFNTFQSGLATQFASINQGLLGSSTGAASNSFGNMLGYAPMVTGLNSFWNPNFNATVKPAAETNTAEQNLNIEKPQINNTGTQTQIPQNAPVDEKDLENWMNETEKKLIEKQNSMGGLSKTDIRILGLIKRTKEGNATELMRKDLLEMYNMSRMAQLKPKIAG